MSYLKIYFETASIYENTKVTILPKVASTITREFLSADSSYSNGFLKVLGQFFCGFHHPIASSFQKPVRMATKDLEELFCDCTLGFLGELNLFNS